METDIKTWSETHHTSEPIAEAIHKLADGNTMEMERIWQYPTDEQLCAIWRWSTDRGQIDPRKLVWNGRTFADVVR